MPSGVYKRTQPSPLIGIKRPIRSEEWKRKLSESHKGKFVGERHPRWGVKLSDETKKRISESEKGKKDSSEVRLKKSLARIGDKNPAWKGGVSYEPYSHDWTDFLKESIRLRDLFICQECGIHQHELQDNWHKKLDVHHIDYNKKNCSPDNLISLCRPCHIKTNYSRDYWLGYFKNKKNV
jgi:hypothetical protein